MVAPLAIQFGSWYAKWGDAIVYVNMDVNQSWRHDHPSRIKNLARFGFQDVRCNAHNFTLADCNIGFCRDALRRIDDAA